MDLITISQFQKKHKLGKYWFFNLKCEKPKVVKMEKRCVRKVALYDEAELEKLLPVVEETPKLLITIAQFAEKKGLEFLELCSHRDTNDKFPKPAKTDIKKIGGKDVELVYYDEDELRKFCRVNDIKPKGFDNFGVKSFLARPFPDGLSWQKERSLDSATESNSARA